MRVTGATIHPIHLPLRDPFVVAYARWESMPSIILELHTDTGLTGWGESVPDETVTGESHSAAVAMLRDVLLPAVLGREVADIDGAHAAMATAVGANPSVKAAIDLALHDLLGQAGGMPLHQLLGGSSERPLTYPRVISVGAPEAMAHGAEAALGEGFTEIKIKVGAGEPREDIARVRAVCEAVGDRARVRVDVNQHWGTPAVAVPAIRQLEGLGLRWIEQPVHGLDITGLAEVRAVTSVPIMADESVHGMASLLQIIRERAADAVNLKLMKTGGLQPAAALVAVAQAAGLWVQIGSMVESSIGSAAGYHLAAARSHVTSTELTGPLLFSRDVGDLAYEPPTVRLSQRAGLGVQIDRDALEALRVGGPITL
ncbi:mandelate racemase/muconate lactonizing enzyme family protein [Ornithinimicrobium faecis]|uniref:mandelate racemase/muconate lactonizing enzyme family protein n=1 Tax=Ornithinimicrobium faecis TaxID=2934158 RepID=UPI0021175B65|nr:dipeptide epimerase [Ornithinimicrobium sp. HY1745]